MRIWTYKNADEKAHTFSRSMLIFKKHFKKHFVTVYGGLRSPQPPGNFCNFAAKK